MLPYPTGYCPVLAEPRPPAQKTGGARANFHALPGTWQARFLQAPGPHCAWGPRLFCRLSIFFSCPDDPARLSSRCSPGAILGSVLAPEAHIPCATRPLILSDACNSPTPAKPGAASCSFTRPCSTRGPRAPACVMVHASDLVQDVLVVLVQELPRFAYDRRKSFRAWLHKVTINKWRENHRRQVPCRSTRKPDHWPRFPAPTTTRPSRKPSTAVTSSAVPSRSCKQTSSPAPGKPAGAGRGRGGRPPRWPGS